MPIAMRVVNIADRNAGGDNKSGDANSHMRWEMFVVVAVCGVTQLEWMQLESILRVALRVEISCLLPLIPDRVHTHADRSMA